MALARCEQMLLALRCGRDRKVAVIEPLRMPQHRLRHRDVVVGRKGADSRRWAVGIRARRLESWRARSSRSSAARRAINVVEQRDVLFGVAVRARDKQVGDAPQRGRALSSVAESSASSISSIRLGNGVIRRISCSAGAPAPKRVQGRNKE